MVERLINEKSDSVAAAEQILHQKIESFFAALLGWLLTDASLTGSRHRKFCPISFWDPMPARVTRTAFANWPSSKFQDRYP